MANALKAGAAAIDISPTDSQFLYGDPFVERYSTGVHDPLLSSALYLADGRSEIILIANDIIWFNKAATARIRAAISREAGLPPSHVMITATHTHSAPIPHDVIINAVDPAVPPADPAYVRHMEGGVVRAAIQSRENAKDAAVGLTIASCDSIGTNRHDPQGPADPDVPVLAVKSRADDTYIACLLVCAMHPTVLHEDSTLASADFPGRARDYLQKNIIGENCPVLHLTGPCGNQSPRHVTRSNTFEEATRLGELLAHAVAGGLAQIETSSDVILKVTQAFLDLPRKTFPPRQVAQKVMDH